MNFKKDIIQEIKKLKDIGCPSDFYIKENKKRLLEFIKEDKASRGEEVLCPDRSKNISYGFWKTYKYRILKPVGVLLLVLSIITTGGVGMSFASQDSLPGDTFYPVKLTLEKAQVSLKINEEDKVRLEVEFAGRRLEELNKVEVKEIIENKKESEKKKIALNNFKKNIETVNKRLEKIKDKKFTKETVELVNIVEEKTLGYTKTLKNISSSKDLEKKKILENEIEKNEEIKSSDEKLYEEQGNISGLEGNEKEDKGVSNEEGGAEETGEPGNQESVSGEIVQKNEEDKAKVIATNEQNDKLLNEELEMKKVIKDALESSEELNIKAVDIILEKHKTGEIELPQNELTEKVQNKVNDAKTEIKDLKEKVEIIKKAEGDKGIGIAEEGNKSNQEDEEIKENEEDLEDVDKEAGTSTLKEILEKPDEEMNKLDDTLNEADELLEQGEIFNAFDKVKEINKLTKDFKDKIEIAEEKIIQQTSEGLNEDTAIEQQEIEDGQENIETDEENSGQQEELINDENLAENESSEENATTTDLKVGN